MTDIRRLQAVGAVTALLMALGLIFSMSAEADTCQTITFTEDGYIGSRSGNVETVHTGLIGSNLWVNTGELEDDADLGVGSVTVKVPAGATEATICEDSSVAFLVPTADPMPVPVVVDVPATPVVPAPVETGTDPLSSEIPWAPMVARV